MCYNSDVYRENLDTLDMMRLFIKSDVWGSMQYELPVYAAYATITGDVVDSLDGVKEWISEAEYALILRDIDDYVNVYGGNWEDIAECGGYWFDLS